MVNFHSLDAAIRQPKPRILDELDALSAYRPICTADALYGLDLGCITKSRLSQFLIGLK